MEKELRQAENELIKIVLYGPESTGKTSLARALALKYNTEWIPEFARDYLQDKYNASAEICEPEDLIPIAKGQLESENFKSQNAKRYVFCDTDVLQTLVYAKAYFENFQNPILEQCVEECHYAHYFLTYIDAPWVEDDLRDKPNQRESMFAIFEHELIQRNLPYTILKGDLKQRLSQAAYIIKTL
jgi:NadR type nicotinamide-nucleotide adenylyltransferase